MAGEAIRPVNIATDAITEATILLVPLWRADNAPLFIFLTWSTFLQPLSRHMPNR